MFKKALCIFGGCLLALLLLCACDQQPSLKKLSAFWGELYGENRIVRMPEREQYALLFKADSSDNTFVREYDLVPFRPSEDDRWSELYEGDLYSIKAESASYSPRDEIRLVLSNNSDYVITHNGELYGLEIRCGEQWYPVFSTRHGGMLVEYAISPRQSQSIEINSASLSAAAGFHYRLNENDQYEPFRVTDSIVALIPGHYRFLISIFSKDNSMDRQNLSCSFTVQ